MACTARKNGRRLVLLNGNHRRPERCCLFAPLHLSAFHEPMHHGFIRSHPRCSVPLLHSHLSRAQLGYSHCRVYVRRPAGLSRIRCIRPGTRSHHRHHTSARGHRCSHPVDFPHGALHQQPTGTHEPHRDFRRRLPRPADPDQAMGGTLRCRRHSHLGNDRNLPQSARSPARHQACPAKHAGITASARGDSLQAWNTAW